MNRHIATLVRDESCSACKMCDGASTVCQTGDGPSDATIMVVGKIPNAAKYQDTINAALADAGLEPDMMYHTSAIKCRSWEKDPGVRDIKACKQYLDAEIEAIKPKWILAFGNEALQALTGHSGIMKYRGKAIERGDATIIPTLSPASILRNPGQRLGWLTDLRYFASQVYGTGGGLAPPKVAIIDTAKKLKALKRKLKGAQLISYDIETHGEAEHVPGARIVSLSATTVLEDGKLFVWAMPLGHPQSPFRRSWRSALKLLAPALVAIPKQVAHNGKFDARWLRYFGVEGISLTFDTMLAAHLLDENRQKGLKPQATSRLGVAPWAIDTKDLLSTPIREVLKYNALDTYYTYHIYLQMKDELKAQERLLRIFMHITMPSCRVLIAAELRGIWVDQEKLATNTKIAHDLMKAEEEKLQVYIPMPPHAEGYSCEECRTGKHKVAKDWPRMGRGRGKLAEINYNPSNWARWWLFEHLHLPVLARGKDKDDGGEGAPSMAEAVMMELKQHHAVPKILLERTRVKMMTQFFASYAENLDENNRIHTTFKLAGTVTGRLSSGKEDEEKFTGRVDRRGVNIQQVPRDPFVRGLFGAQPGYWFVEADFSQIELRVVAFIARERKMMFLYQTGQDIHRATASNVLGVPPDKVSSDDRKKAKAVNFGFVYGMGWRKFILTAFEKYELVFSEFEAQAVRRAYFEQFPDLLAWHARQRRLVKEYKRVQSPIGRIRRLPDIDSPDRGVQGEAERQAINSPVQSFASDMTQLSMSMLAKKFKDRDLDAHVIGTVHDASLFEIRKEHTAEALPLIKETMENLPLMRLFGVEVDVPIVVDLKVGTHWGGATELNTEQIYNWDESILAA